MELKLFESIDSRKKLLDTKRPLSKPIVAKMKEHFDILWTYNSNAIEGNTLSLEETKVVLLHGITVGGKTLREHLEVTNHKEAIDYVESLVFKGVKNITEKELLKIHYLVLKNIDSKNAGRYRKVQVMIGGVDKKLPLPERIPYEMEDFIGWLNKFKGHPIEHSALAHYKFVEIHPFVDGNGRTARLLMNLILMSKGYPPAIILMRERVAYYNSLKKADAGDYREIVSIVANAVNKSLDIYLEATQ